ncbi:MAG: Rpn family recombination-promoting nuclease/putative transposase [Dolichospermum sp.]
MQWLIAEDIDEIEVLPTELPINPIRADALFRLPKLNRILHLEIQTTPKSDTPMPVRMLDYWLRIYRKYLCPIQQVVIFLKETNSPDVFVDRLIVGNTRHQYQVIRVWEEDSEILLKSPALLPLAVLAKTDEPNKLLQQVALEIDKIEEQAQQNTIAACVELLAGLKFEKQLIKQYFREETMEESVIYQEIINRGKLELISRLLKRRIGEISAKLESQIKELSGEKLDELSEAILDFSQPDDLVNWMANHS